MIPIVRRHWGAWIALSLGLALHVVDEALTDFLSVYNPTVEAIRNRFPYVPLPTFTFEIWIAGLIFAVILLLSLSSLIIRSRKWSVPISYGLAAIMLMNGLLHIGGSLYLGRLMPGVYSSPVLIGVSIYLLKQAYQRRRVDVG